MLVLCTLSQARDNVEKTFITIKTVHITNPKQPPTFPARSHSRVKRVIYLTSERRLTLPPETVLVLTPTLSLPFARNLPTGYGASMTISIPFKSKAYVTTTHMRSSIHISIHTLTHFIQNVMLEESGCRISQAALCSFLR